MRATATINGVTHELTCRFDEEGRMCIYNTTGVEIPAGTAVSIEMPEFKKPETFPIGHLRDEEQA